MAGDPLNHVEICDILADHAERSHRRSNPERAGHNHRAGTDEGMFI